MSDGIQINLGRSQTKDWCTDLISYRIAMSLAWQGHDIIEWESMRVSSGKNLAWQDHGMVTGSSNPLKSKYPDWRSHGIMGAGLNIFYRKRRVRQALPLPRESINQLLLPSSPLSEEPSLPHSYTLRRALSFGIWIPQSSRILLTLGLTSFHSLQLIQWSFVLGRLYQLNRLSVPLVFFRWQLFQHPHQYLFP